MPPKWMDESGFEQFDADLMGNLYKIWNRMSSGSYFPPPVRAVSIPKKNCGQRILRVSTVADRVAQMVVKQIVERTLEPIFLPDSYGYRPNKSAIKKISCLAPTINLFRNSINSVALTPPFSLIMNRIWPREEIARSSSSHAARPWFQQWEFHLFYPRRARRGDRNACGRHRAVNPLQCSAIEFRWTSRDCWLCFQGAPTTTPVLCQPSVHGGPPHTKNLGNHFGAFAFLYMLHRALTHSL
jgi:hypothetical protein